MQTISATYRVTTPMFLGGADPQQAELRLSSFKGALRFWWRALAWDRCQDVQKLRREEAALFGSSDEDFGQSQVLMKMQPVRPTMLEADRVKMTQLKDGEYVIGQGTRYLGYGVIEAFKRWKRDNDGNYVKGRSGDRIPEILEGQLIRSCLLAPFSFTVELLFKTDVSDEQRGQIRKALKLLGVLGGLGSKARKGYGSVALTSLVIKQRRDDVGTEDWKPPEKPQELIERLGELLDSSQIQAGNADSSVFDNLPEWTAFSPASRILVLSPDGQDRTPLALLNRVGLEMVRYRSWGKNGKVLGNQPREEIFKDDHHLMVVERHPRKSHPERIVFGLPHNYGKKEHRKDVEPTSFDRRASPLLIHVHQTTEISTPIAVVTFLPSRFLPEDQSEISVGGNKVKLAKTDLWKPIEDWFKRLKDEIPKPHDRKERFGTVVEVKHG